MDEFFSLLSGTTKRRTWHFRNQKAQIPLRERKLGMTCSITTCGTGEVLGMQMIWKGKTANSGARVSNDETPGLTHAFQPADQFVISTLKALVHTGWNKYVEALFAQHDVEAGMLNRCEFSV